MPGVFSHGARGTAAALEKALSELRQSRQKLAAKTRPDAAVRLLGGSDSTREHAQYGQVSVRGPGPSRIDLLEAIGHEGSIAGAARAIQVSRESARAAIDIMNRQAEAALVMTVSGGGAAQLT